jgi:GNAT superfamily N-acetyltransferase
VTHDITLASDPDDPDLAALVALLERTLADPNTVLGIDRVREFVASPGAGREFRVLVARSGADVVGGAIFSYVPASNCGFSEYIVTAPDIRGAGLGRRIFNARKAILDKCASAHGFTHGCNGLFIEVDNPERTPPELLAAERITALDARERLRIFGHLGFLRVDVRYVQPPLAPDKTAVDYLDLLFAPWTSLQPSSSITASWVTRTVEPIWRAWAPETYAAELGRLRTDLGDRDVRLYPLAEA